MAFAKEKEMSEKKKNKARILDKALDYMNKLPPMPSTFQGGDTVDNLDIVLDQLDVYFKSVEAIVEEKA